MLFKEIWSSLTVSSMFTSFHQRPCVTTHQAGGQVGLPWDVCGDLQLDLSISQAPAGAAPQRSQISKLQNPQKAKGEELQSGVQAQTFQGWCKEPARLQASQVELQGCQLLQVSSSRSSSYSLSARQERMVSITELWESLDAWVCALHHIRLYLLSHLWSLRQTWL